MGFFFGDFQSVVPPTLVDAAVESPSLRVEGYSNGVRILHEKVTCVGRGAG